MTFATKYEKGQKVWVMRGENVSAKPVEVRILSITIFLEENGNTRICYNTRFQDNENRKEYSYAEQFLFATKKELLDSL